MTDVTPYTPTFDFATDPNPQDLINAAALQGQLNLIADNLADLNTATSVSLRDDNTLTDELVRLRNLSEEVSSYIESGISGAIRTENVTYLLPVTVATTANITLSNLQTIDGVTLFAGDRVLVKNQTLTVDNGVWIAADMAAWTRAADLPAGAAITSNLGVVVQEGGTTNADTAWQLRPLPTTTNPDVYSASPVVGTDLLGWFSIYTLFPLPITKGGTGSTTAAAARTALGAASSIDLYRANVRDYGAVGDGVADDTVAIQAAIDTGLPVFIPPGIYLVSSVLTLGPAEQTLYGAGRSETFIKVSTAFDLNPVTSPAVFNVYRPVPSTDPTETFISDLSIDFTHPGAALRASLTSYPPAIRAHGKPRCRFERLRITQAMIAFDLTGNSGGTDLDDVEVSSFVYGIQLDGSLDSVKISRWHQFPFSCTGGVGGLVWVTVSGGLIMSVAREDDGDNYTNGTLATTFTIPNGVGGVVTLNVAGVDPGPLTGSTIVNQGSGYDDGVYRLFIVDGTNSIYDDGTSLAMLCTATDDLKVSNSLILRQAVQLVNGFGEFSAVDFDGTAKLRVTGGWWQFASCIMSTRDTDYAVDVAVVTPKEADVCFSSCDFIGNIVHFPMIRVNHATTSADNVLSFVGCNFRFAGGLAHNVISATAATMNVCACHFDIAGFWTTQPSLVPSIQLSGAGRYSISNSIWGDRSGAQDFVNITGNSLMFAQVHDNIAPGWNLTTTAYSGGFPTTVAIANNDLGVKLLTTTFAFLSGPTNTLVREGILDGSGAATVPHGLTSAITKSMWDVRAWGRGTVVNTVEPLTVSVNATNILLTGGATPAAQVVTAAARGPVLTTFGVAGHGLVSDETIYLAGFVDVGWTTLNTNTYVVTIVDVNNFTIPVDSSGFVLFTGAGGDITLRPQYRVALTYGNHISTVW